MTAAPTIADAYKEFPLLEGEALTTCIEAMRKHARELDGFEVQFPDWPEAHAAAEAYPKELHLGSPRGPGGRWRRLIWLGDAE